MDFTKELAQLSENVEILKEEIEYYQNRVNAGKVTVDDRNYVVDEIKLCRKILNILNAKVKSIAIIRKEHYNSLANFR